VKKCPGFAHQYPKYRSGWEEMLPQGVAEIIKRNHLFGYDPKKIVAEQGN